jgi:hypothetical protein
MRSETGVLVHSDLHPKYVGLSLLDDGTLLRLSDSLFHSGDEHRDPWVHYELDSPLTTATVVRQSLVLAEPTSPLRNLLAAGVGSLTTRRARRPSYDRRTEPAGHRRGAGRQEHLPTCPSAWG